MKKKTGLLIYCPDCYRNWSENQVFPDMSKVYCTGCQSTIQELREIKSKRLSRSISGSLPKGKRK